MQSFHISFELFREFCKGQLFNTCRHPGNGHEGSLHSCCANFCPVIEEAKRRQVAEEFNNYLTTQVKTPPEEPATSQGEIPQSAPKGKVYSGGGGYTVK